MQMPLSIPFLRKQIRLGKLKSRKFGDRVVVLAEDWNEYLGGGTGEDDAETKN